LLTIHTLIWLGTILGTVFGLVFEGFLEATRNPAAFVLVELGGLNDVGTAMLTYFSDRAPAFEGASALCTSKLCHGYFSIARYTSL
jgi:hypothetical protein